jgi:hypothetical protein
MGVHLRLLAVAVTALALATGCNGLFAGGLGDWNPDTTPSGDGSSCVSYDPTPACPQSQPLAYQCLATDLSPSSNDSVACNPPVADPDGLYDDYCCSDVSYDDDGGFGPWGSSSGGSSSSSGGGYGYGDDGGIGGDAALPPGCTTDPAIACAGDALGYACVTGVDPESYDPTLACSAPTVREGEVTYCCYDGFPGAPSCVPDDTVVPGCPAASPYGFQCNGGFSPSAFDTSLTCAPPAIDPENDLESYCCSRA